MKKSTLEKMTADRTMSDIQRTMAGSLMATRKRNGRIDLPAAAHKLIGSYPMPLHEALQYADIVSSEADNREWTG